MDLNKPNEMIEIFPGKVWTKRIPLRFLGVQIGTRMTVIKLRNGDLFVHSPVLLDEETKAELDNRGKVRYIVSPNNMHHFFIDKYITTYPFSKAYAPPGLAKKRPDLKFFAELKEAPEYDWKNEIDQVIFHGNPESEEVVFFHMESKTLILGDAIMNFDESYPLLTRFATKILGIYNKPSQPMDYNLNSSQLMQAYISVEKILQWDFNRIILAHGKIIEDNGYQIFKQVYSWVLESAGK